MTNSILLDAAQDLWRYVSDDYLTLRVVTDEVGSSTLPQKVNPIDFEMTPGNLGVANAILAHYAQKLPVSRLQRDPSDSTVRRTFGVALGHALVAYLNFARGLDRIAPNEAKLRADLDAHWDVIAEGAQTILRAAGIEQAYEQLKTLTRGKTITPSEYASWVENLSVEEGMVKTVIAQAGGETKTITTEKALVAVGRRPASQRLVQEMEESSKKLLEENVAQRVPKGISVRCRVIQDIPLS